MFRLRGGNETFRRKNIRSKARDFEGLLLSGTMFISFKCTIAENIYLFIISECHLRIFFYYRIISLTSSLKWGGFIECEVIVVPSRLRELIVSTPVNDTCDCSHDTDSQVTPFQ